MAQREVIRPSTNIPVLFLIDAEPTQKESAFGPPIQHQYICNDGAAIMWLDPAAHAAIVRTGARPGDVVSLVKRGGGSRSTWEAEVQPVDDQTGAGGSRPAAATTPAPAPKPAPPARRVPQPISGGNAHTEPAKAAPAKAAAPGDAQQRPAARVLAAALCSAIDAMQEAEQYAASRGLTLNFSVDDVRAMGISLYISAEKAGQR